MASIRREITISVAPDEAWSALRDWGAIHQRLAPGFVIHARVEGRDRIVTFFNGTILRELLVDLDDEAHRLAWSIVDGPYTHHNASAQIFPSGDGGATFVWIADVLPDETVDRTGGMMERGLAVIKQTLETRATSHGSTP
jgi:hypothetical protein